MKFYTAFFCLFFNTIISQNIKVETAIDTNATTYKNELISLFKSRTIATEKVIESIVERNSKKDVTKTYKEKIEEFTKKIEKGIFIKHPVYSFLLDSIFSEIKKGNPDQNFNEIEILIAISDEKNAYNIGENIVVFNLPLLFQLENKYQVASVLCHEIAHQKLNHVQNSIIQHAKVNNSKEVKDKTKEIAKQKYNRNQFASQLLKKLIYNNKELSRKLELEADSLGFVYFNKAFKNNIQAPLETLTLLKSLDKEKDSLTIEDYKEILKNTGLTFNKEWFTSELSGYNYQKGNKFWNIDSLRTHPDCEERILYLKKIFNLNYQESNQSSSNYSALKKEASKELIFSLYFLELYGDSLYQALISHFKERENPFYKQMIYSNLLKIQKARANYTLNQFLESENPKFSDSYNRFLLFCRNIKKAELQTLIDHFK